MQLKIHGDPVNVYTLGTDSAEPTLVLQPPATTVAALTDRAKPHAACSGLLPGAQLDQDLGILSLVACVVRVCRNVGARSSINQ